MHYYQFHVSDYIHDTAHLSLEEDLAFRRLLDLYYTQEKPIPNKTHEVARRIRMAKHEHSIQIVLEEFFMFDIENDCWTHKRCDETISAYQAKAERNRAIGKLGGRPKANHQETQTVSNSNPNQEPITINQEPKKKATVVACPPDVQEQVWRDWQTLRKMKKAPVTETVVDSAKKEAAKANMSFNDFLVVWCRRGSQGLEADWLKPHERQSFAQQAADIARSTVPAQNSGPDPVLVKIEADRQKAAPMPAHIRQQINQVLGKV
jgi:uncharacterized protein YdaU (DUF1376 family)